MSDPNDVRNFLAKMADEVGTPAVDPQPVVRRARFRRGAMFAVTGIAAAVVAVGAFAGLDALRSPSDPLPADPIPGIQNGAILVGETLVDLETKERTNLSFCEGCTPGDVAWSPDGTQVAFVRPCDTCDSNDPATAAIYDVESDEIVEPELSTCTVPQGEKREYCSVRIDWSPDGSRLAIAQSYRLDIVSIDDGLRTTIARFPYRQGVVGHPSWAPNGEALVFSVNFGDVFDGESRIYQVGVAGEEPPKVLFFESGNDYTFSDPDWSPTGLEWAFLRVIETDGGGSVSSVSVATAEEPYEAREVFGGNPCLCVGPGLPAPSWSPDGTRLAITASSPRSLILVDPGSAPGSAESKVAVEGVTGQVAWRPES